MFESPGEQSFIPIIDAFNEHIDIVIHLQTRLDENKWIFLNEVEREGRRVTFDKRHYYEQIPGGEINKNPLLIRNDGY